MKNFSLLFSLVPLSLFALPEGEVVKSGKASLTRGENSLVIEASDRAILHYESFNIGKGEKVEFLQPGRKATVLNRVVGKDPSSILGNLSSNGRIFLLNSNGIYFGKDAVVNVGSLIASTLDLYDRDFEKGRYPFFSTGYGEIINEGILSAAPEGIIALLAAHVQNEGTIRADIGKILVASAEKITLDLVGDGLMSFTLQRGELLNADAITVANALIEVEGSIRLVAHGVIEAEDIAILGSDIRVEGSVVAKNDLLIEASEAITLRDDTENPLKLHAYRDLKLQGELIDIFALNHPETSIASGGPMALVSSNPISADGHFYSGGDFSLLTFNGKPGDFLCYWDPIISATGSVTFGAYTGTSLLVESTGAITITGDITITGTDTLPCDGTNCFSDDCSALKLSKALILNPGLSSLQENCLPIPPNTTVMTTSFQTSATPPSNTVYLFGNISGADQVIIRGNIILGSGVTITPPATSPSKIQLLNVDGAFSFDITGGGVGSIVSLGTLGGDTPIASFSTNFGTTTLNGNITTDSSIIISSDQLLLNQDATLSAMGLLLNIPQTDSVSGQSYSLTLAVSSGTANVGGSIGSIDPLSGFTVNDGSELNLNGNITTDNGPITIVPVLELGTASTTLSAGSGAVSLGAVSATGAGMAFEVDTTGAVTFNGTVGMVALDSFVVNAGSVTGQAVNSGIVTINSSGSVNFSGSISATQNMAMNSISGTGVVQLGGLTTPGGSMGSFSVIQTAGGSSPALNLGGTFSVDGDLTLTAASSTYILANTSLDSLEGTLSISTPSINDSNTTPTSSLTLSAPMSNVTVTASGGIGLTNALTSFTVTNGIGVILPAVRAGSIGITATNLTLNGSLTSLTGGISITAATTLGASVTLNAGMSPLTITGNISSLTNGFNLTLDASSISLNGDISLTNGSITANAPIDLQGPATFTTNGRPISLEAVTGAETLTLDAGTGAVTLNGDIGTMGTPLTSLTVDCNRLGPNPPVASIFAGTISITSSNGMTLGNMAANVGGITLNDTSSTAVNLGGTMSANGAFLLMGGSEPILIVSNTSISSATSSITLQGTSINASSSLTNSFLTLDAVDAISLPTSGIGQAAPLSGFTITNTSSVTVPAVTVNLGAIDITATDLTLNGNLTAPGGISIAAATTLGASVALNAGVLPLTIVGNIESTTNGFNLTMRGSDISLDGNITLVNGAITANAPIQLQGPAILTSDGQVISLKAVTGAEALTLDAGTAAVALNGNIGTMGTPLTSLTVNSNGVGPNPPVASIFAGTISITSSSGIALGSMTANVGGITLNDTSSAAVNLGGTISANGAFLLMGGSEPIFILSNTSITSLTSSITLEGTAIDASSSLTSAFLSLNAAAAISVPTGGIGQTNPLSGFTIVNASSVTVPPVTTNTGGISLTSSMLSLNGNLTANNGPIALNSPALLLQSITLSSGIGAVTLGGDITAMSSGFNFTVMGRGLTSLSGNITLSNGAITLNPPLLLTGVNPILSSSGGAISLGQVNGMENLTLNAGPSANVTINGPVGSLAPLTGLTVTAAILTQADAVTTNGPVSYTANSVNVGGNIVSGGGAITIDADLNLTSSAIFNSSPGGMISITGPINGDVAGDNLTLLSGIGTITLGDDVGNTKPLNHFTINGGAITFAGALYEANIQSYTGSSFDFTTTSQLNLVSSTGGIAFNMGSIQINSSLVVNTHGGNFSFPDLFGTSGLHVNILAGSGNVTLGQIGMTGQFGTITTFAEDIFFAGPIVTNRVQLFAAGSIVNIGVPSHTITMNSTAIFETSSGTIGSISSPIAVNTTGIVIAGTPSQLADFSGTAQGNTIFVDPNNIPCPLIFNGIEIYPCPTPPPPPPPPAPPPEPPSPILGARARDFYVPGVYSQYDSLASDYYFLPEVVDEDYVRTRYLLVFTASRTFSPNENSSGKLIRKVKGDYEQRRMVSSPSTDYKQ
jgi:filamentous hemagglutinin family protein